MNSKNRILFNVDVKDASSENLEFFNSLKEKHESKTELFLHLLSCAREVENNTKNFIRGNVTLNYIADMVNRQMEINKTTKKTHIIGSGKKTITVKYEQRSITDKWIMDTSIEERNAKIDNARSVSRKSAQEYLTAKKPEVDEHHKWLCEQIGVEYNTDSVRNFNRRTGKAAAAVARLRG